MQVSGVSTEGCQTGYFMSGYAMGLCICTFNHAWQRKCIHMAAGTGFAYTL